MKATYWDLKVNVYNLSLILSALSIGFAHCNCSRYSAMASAF